jgi:hypothetical protein
MITPCFMDNKRIHVLSQKASTFSYSLLECDEKEGQGKQKSDILRSIVLFFTTTGRQEGVWKPFRPDLSEWNTLSRSLSHFTLHHGGAEEPNAVPFPPDQPYGDRCPPVKNR